MRRRFLVAAGLFLALAGVALSGGSAYAYFWDRGNADVIAAGVRIAGVDVGGLDAAQARALLDARVVRPLGRPVTLVGRRRRFVVDPQRAGLRVDVDRMVAEAVAASRRGGLADRVLRAVEGKRLRHAVPLRGAVSPDAIATLVAHVARVLDRPARSAQVIPTADTLHVVGAHAGLAVRRAELARAVATSLLHPHTRTIAIPTRTLEPRWTAATLPRRYPAYILVDRETFQLRFYRHLKLVKTYPIAVGRAGLETPAGLYSIDDKQVDPSWHVPNSAWAGSLAGRIIPPGPDDPIKARWMGFWNGSGIHGTADTWSLGSAASHGCIRMSIPDVIELYSMVPLGTPIYVG